MSWRAREAPPEEKTEAPASHLHGPMTVKSYLVGPSIYIPSTWRMGGDTPEEDATIYLCVSLLLALIVT